MNSRSRSRTNRVPRSHARRAARERQPGLPSACLPVETVLDKTLSMTDTGSDREVTFPDIGCFGCSPTNEHGLRLRFHRRGEEVYALHTVPPAYQGAPGIVHGGILATIIDEVSCATVVALRGTHVVTGELSVRYMRPCPVGAPLEISARVVGEHPRYLIVEAHVCQDDTVLARSTGKFFPQTRAENAP